MLVQQNTHPEPKKSSIKNFFKKIFRMNQASTETTEDIREKLLEQDENDSELRIIQMTDVETPAWHMSFASQDSLLTYETRRSSSLDRAAE